MPRSPGRPLAALALALALSVPSAAQRVDAPPAGLHAPRQSRPAVVAVGAYGTRLELGEGQSVRQVAVPVYVAVPIGELVGISAQTRYVTASGEGLTRLGGLSDLGLTATAEAPLGGASLVVSLAGSVPLGSRQLEPGAFATAALLSRDDLALDVPSLGQGPRLAPGVTLAVPVGEGAAFGLGASALVSGAYRPFVGDDLEYAPAREVLLTAGVDVQGAPGSGLSLDVAYVTYGDDAFGGRTFRPGDKLVAALRWTRGPGFLALRARYLRDGARQDSVEIAPARPFQGAASGGVLLGTEAFSVGIALGARYYGDFRSGEATSATAGLIDVLGRQQLLLEGGATPSVRLAPGTLLTLSAGYTLGIGAVLEIGDIPPLSGVRIGAGVQVEL